MAHREGDSDDALASTRKLVQQVDKRLCDMMSGESLAALLHTAPYSSRLRFANSDESKLYMRYLVNTTMQELLTDPKLQESALTGRLGAKDGWRVGSEEDKNSHVAVKDATSIQQSDVQKVAVQSCDDEQKQALRSEGITYSMRHTDNRCRTEISGGNISSRQNQLIVKSIQEERKTVVKIMPKMSQPTANNVGLHGEHVASGSKVQGDKIINDKNNKFVSTSSGVFVRFPRQDGAMSNRLKTFDKIAAKEEHCPCPICSYERERKEKSVCKKHPGAQAEGFEKKAVGDVRKSLRNKQKSCYKIENMQTTVQKNSLRSNLSKTANKSNVGKSSEDADKQCSIHTDAQTRELAAHSNTDQSGKPCPEDGRHLCESCEGRERKWADILNTGSSSVIMQHVLSLFSERVRGNKWKCSEQLLNWAAASCPVHSEQAHQDMSASQTQYMGRQRQGSLHDTGRAHEHPGPRSGDANNTSTSSNSILDEQSHQRRVVSRNVHLDYDDACLQDNYAGNDIQGEAGMVARYMDTEQLTTQGQEEEGTPSETAGVGQCVYGCTAPAEHSSGGWTQRTSAPHASWSLPVTHAQRGVQPHTDASKPTSSIEEIMKMLADVDSRTLPTNQLQDDTDMSWMQQLQNREVQENCMTAKKQDDVVVTEYDDDWEEEQEEDEESNTADAFSLSSSGRGSWREHNKLDPKSGNCLASSSMFLSSSGQPASADDGSVQAGAPTGCLAGADIADPFQEEHQVVVEKESPVTLVCVQSLLPASVPNTRTLNDVLDKEDWLRAPPSLERGTPLVSSVSAALSIPSGSPASPNPLSLVQQHMSSCSSLQADQHDCAAWLPAHSLPIPNTAPCGPPFANFSPAAFFVPFHQLSYIIPPTCLQNQHHHLADFLVSIPHQSSGSADSLGIGSVFTTSSATSPFFSPVPQSGQHQTTAHQSTYVSPVHIYSHGQPPGSVQTMQENPLLLAVQSTDACTYTSANSADNLTCSADKGVQTSLKSIRATAAQVCSVCVEARLFKERLRSSAVPVWRLEDGSRRQAVPSPVVEVTSGNTSTSDESESSHSRKTPSLGLLRTTESPTVMDVTTSCSDQSEGEVRVGRRVSVAPGSPGEDSPCDCSEGEVCPHTQHQVECVSVGEMLPHASMGEVTAPLSLPICTDATHHSGLPELQSLSSGSSYDHCDVPFSG